MSEEAATTPQTAGEEEKPAVTDTEVTPVQPVATTDVTTTEEETPVATTDNNNENAEEEGSPNVVEEEENTTANFAPVVRSFLFHLFVNFSFSWSGTNMIIFVYLLIEH
jgi:hypothetical protein